MESTRSSGKMKAQKVKASNENISPLQMEMENQRGRYLQSMTMGIRIQPFTENIAAGSPLARYFFGGSPLSVEVVTTGDTFTSPTFASSKYRSAKSQQYSGSNLGSSSLGPRGRLSLSPLSSVENLDMAQLRSPPMYETPVKVDEEVLVMDDILVRSTPGGKNGRSSLSSSGRDLASSSASSTCSSLPWVKSEFKTEVCRNESGNCRNNSQSQFAQEEEEMQSHLLHMKPRYEAQKGKGKPPLSARSGAHGSNGDTVKQHRAPVRFLSRRNLAPPDPNSSREWSPLDDGIKVHFLDASDKAPSREEVNSRISVVLHKLLNGLSGQRRLPVFVTLSDGHESVIDTMPSQQ